MKSKIIILLLVMTVIITACTVQKPPQIDEEPQDLPPATPSVGGSIVIGTDVDSLYLDPLGLQMSKSPLYNLTTILYQGLLGYNEKLELDKNLAADYLLDIENNQLIFSLQEGLKWQNGTDLTLEDIQSTLEWYSQGEYNGKWKSYTLDIIGTDDFRKGKSENVSGITISDEKKQITVAFKQLDPADLQLFTAPILSASQLSDISVSQIKEQAGKGLLLANGPFKLQSQSADNSEWQLIRNDYYPGLVYLDKIIFRNSEQGVQDLQLTLPMDESLNDETRDTLLLDGQGYTYLGMNLNTEVWKDLNNREALSKALDYDKIIQSIYFGFGKRPLSVLHPMSYAYQAILANSSEETAPVNFAGQKLTLKLAYESNPLQELLAKELAEQLKQNGLTIELTPVASDQYIPQLFSKGAWDLFLASWPYEVDLTKENSKWLSKNDVLLGGYNVSHLQDSKSDELLLAAGINTDYDSQRELYVQWQEYFMKQNYIIPIVSPQTVFTVDKKLHVQITNSLVPFIDINNWWTEVK